jgi:ATP-binding cassette subfamily B protein
MHALSRLFSYARQYRRDAVIASLYSALNKFFDVLPEVLIGVAVDVVVNRQASFLGRFGVTDTMQQLALIGALTVLIWGGESLFQFLYEVRWRNLAQTLQHDLRLDAYRHVQKLPLAYFETKSTGNLMSVLNDDINQMERFLNGGANSIIQVVCSSLMVGAVFFALAPKLAFISLLPVPLILYGTFWFQQRLAPRYAEVRDAAGVINGRLNNNLLGVATIKAFTAEDFEAEHIREASEHYRQTNAQAIRWSAAITPVIRMAILAGFVATLVYGGWMATHGEIGVGSYSVLVYLTQRLLWPLTGLADIADLYQRSMASIDRVLNVLETPVTIPYEGAALAPGSVAGALKFSDVGFGYGDVPVLQHLNLAISAGKTTAFVGATGSGKSTLVKLLLRFYAPDHGAILLDGRDIAGLDLTDLRRNIGYVSQDVFLTDGTVADNIAYGMADVQRAEVIRRGGAAMVPMASLCGAVQTAADAAVNLSTPETYRALLS